MDTYSLRLLLRPPSGSPANSLIVDRIFAALESLGVAEDVSGIAPDGTYTLWLSVTTSDLESAVHEAVTCLYKAHEAATPGRGPDQLVSIEVLVDSHSGSDEQRLTPTG